MSKQNLKSLSGVSKSMKKTAEEARTRRREQYLALKALTTLKRVRTRRQLTPSDRFMTQIVRVLAKLPKTYRHQNGSIYHPRQRLSEFLFNGKRVRPNVGHAAFGAGVGRFVNNSHQFTFFPHLDGGIFRNDLWTITFHHNRQPTITRR